MLRVDSTRSLITAQKTSAYSLSSQEVGVEKTRSRSLAMSQTLRAMLLMRLLGGGTASSSCDQSALAQGR